CCIPTLSSRAGAAAAAGPWIQQSHGQLRLHPGEVAELSCNTSNSTWGVNWYREKPDGSLAWIYRSSKYSTAKGKYSGAMRAQGLFSLNISAVQQEDTGFYYCSPSILYPSFGDRTRLVVTDATEPKLSILVPVDVEERGQPLDVVPLLCHLYDLPAGWDTIRWHHGGDTPVVAAAVAEHGVLSAWSLTWVSAEQR
ncbi:KV5AD protein, partial [Anseranas semipalmata]|nr:KV5AD protein [Anseranas semipalmata]